MTPRQIELVQSSLPAILAIRENAAGLFYERLFAIDPTTRPLFAGGRHARAGSQADERDSDDRRSAQPA